MASLRYYVDWSNYRTMLRLVRQIPETRQRRALTATFLVGIPAITTLHAVCFALDPLLFPSLRRTEVRAPVFNVAHARSGTTYLHRMMAKDPQFSYVLLFEMFFPSLLEKRVLRSLLALDAAAGGPLRRRIEAAEDKALAATQDAHRTGLFEPEEDDFLLTCSLGSGMWIALFPYMSEFDFYHLDRWPDRKRRRVMGFYKECVRRQVALNGGATHLSKNPTFTGRVEALIETFPDARFIVPMRNPHETLPSLLKLLQTAWRSRGADERLIAESLRLLAEQSYHAYRHPLEVLERHPEVPVSIVDYRDLVADPERTIRAVYDDLGLELPQSLVEAVRGARSGAHETTHRYSLEEFGLDAHEVSERLADLFEQYDWEPEGMDVS